VAIYVTHKEWGQSKIGGKGKLGQDPEWGRATTKGVTRRARTISKWWTKDSRKWGTVSITGNQQKKE